MNEVVTITQDAFPVPAPRREREFRVVSDPVPILDTARFEHMQRIATAMARSNMIPFTLCKWKDGDVDKWLDLETVTSNCFLVVNQAVRWGMDPFSVISCASMVHGRLTFEGKLIAAVLEAKLGVELDPVWNDKTGDDFGITIGGKLPSGKWREITGTVGEWKTTGKGSPWGSPRRQLLYRGTREWARWWAPGLMLGVYSDDELMDLQDNARAQRAIAVPSQQEHSRQIQATASGASSTASRVDPAPKPPSAPKQQTAPATAEQPLQKSPPKGPPKPPSAPAARTARIETHNIDWRAEIESYTNRVDSCEDAETLVEVIESYGGVFDDAPDVVRAQARRIEAERREQIGEDAPSPHDDLMAELREAVHDGKVVEAALDALSPERRGLVTVEDRAALTVLQRGIEVERQEKKP